MTWRKLVLAAVWIVTVLPCAFCVFTGAGLTAAGHFIQGGYQRVHVWANPGVYANGKL